MLVGMESG